jgi:hypothetical protein
MLCKSQSKSGFSARCCSREQHSEACGPIVHAVLCCCLHLSGYTSLAASTSNNIPVGTSLKLPHMQPSPDTPAKMLLIGTHKQHRLQTCSTPNHMYLHHTSADVTSHHGMM